MKKDYYNSTVIRAGIYLLSVIMTIGVWTAIIIGKIRLDPEGIVGWVGLLELFNFNLIQLI